MIVLDGLEEVRGAAGTELGVTDWITLDQAAIDAFADATGDHYFIHVDPGRAAAETELGSTIAHGLFTLSLGPRCSYELYEIRGFGGQLNYGFGKVRFTAPVPVGSRVRMRATLERVDERAGGATITVTQTFELEGSQRPACVAESLVMLLSPTAR